MILNIYLGTTVINFIVVFLYAYAGLKNLKRKGYKMVNEKTSFSEKIVSAIYISFGLLMPVYNIMNTIGIVLMGDSIYKALEDKCLKEGTIHKPVEEELNDNSKSQTSIQQETNLYTESSKKVKTYEEMTTEEKLAYLQQEREKLINQTSTQVESAFVMDKKIKH